MHDVNNTIIGTDIIGLAIARKLAKYFERIVVIERIVWARFFKSKQRSNSCKYLLSKKFTEETLMLLSITKCCTIYENCTISHIKIQVN